MLERSQTPQLDVRGTNSYGKEWRGRERIVEMGRGGERERGKGDGR